MKKRDVPQDDGACYEGVRRVTYAVDDDGHYAGFPSSGWEAEIAANAVFIAADNTRIRAAWDDARAGDASPLGYHLAVAQMDVALLSAETGLWRWRVRRHLRASPFASLSDALIARYADALGITPAALRALPDEPEQL